MSDDLTTEDSQAIRTILIVEDDEDIGAFLMQALTLESPYRPIVVESSTQALEMVKRIPPDLFIIDYLLREENGLDLYDHLHAIPELETTPVLFLTATNQAHLDLLAQRNLFALKKPFDIEALLRAVEQILEQSERAAA